MSFPLPGEVASPVSSARAQRLQAEVSDLPVDTTEPVPPEEEQSQAGVTATDNCPTQAFGDDWYCFYQYKNYGGRRLQWSASYGTVLFSQYDFVNRTSSWSNKGGRTITVYGRTIAGSDSFCNNQLWTEYDHSRSSSAYPDNTADCFSAS